MTALTPKEGEVQRYDFDHPSCKGHGCCGGGSIEPYHGGDYVHYDDYAAMKQEREKWYNNAVQERVTRVAAEAERDAAVRAAAAWKRSAKLNKELWNDEKEVHAQRCHDVGTLRARLAACEKIVKAAKRYTDSAPYEVAHYSNDANVAYNVLRTAVATAQGDTI